MSDRPLLSIVVTGRNDDHGTDFRDRFFRTLRFNQRELAARAIPHEFVLVEWAPQPGRPLLADLAVEAIPELSAGSNVQDPAYSGSRFTTYVVDPQYQEALSLNPHLQYLEFAAKNVGIRRATGRFVLSTNCDVYIGRQALDVFQRGDLTPRTLYRAVRHDLKLGAEHTNLTWDALEDVRNLERPPHKLRLPLMQGGTGDFVLLDRDTFHELRGFNEVYRLARMGVDHNFLVKAFSAGLEIADIGGPIYHVNHVGSYRLSRNSYEGREVEAPWGDRRWRYHGVIYDNAPSWGLADAPVSNVGQGRWQIDFAWNAVPPLVDLRRIVLPVDRVGRPQPRRYVSKR